MRSNEISRSALKAGVQVDLRLRRRPYDMAPVIALGECLGSLDLDAPSEAGFHLGLSIAIPLRGGASAKTLSQLKAAIASASADLRSSGDREATADDLALCLALYDALGRTPYAEGDAVGFAA